MKAQAKKTVPSRSMPHHLTNKTVSNCRATMREDANSVSSSSHAVQHGLASMSLKGKTQRRMAAMMLELRQAPRRLQQKGQEPRTGVKQAVPLQA